MASQEQVKVSQNLITAAMDQVEGLSKPCLTLASTLRDPVDAILGMGNVTGSFEALADAGNLVVQNIGNGVALNVSYSFTALNETAIWYRPKGPRFMPHILADQRVRLVEPRTAYNGEFLVVFHYMSIGGRGYETRLMMNGYVFTDIRFGTMIPGNPTQLA